MIDDHKKETAEENINVPGTFAGGSTQAIDELNAAITEVTGLPVEVLDERLNNFVRQARTLIAQEEKIEIDLEGAPKESKFAHAKRTKTRFEANYEPLDVKKLVNKVTPAEIVTREEAKPETKGNTARMPMVAVPAETSTMGMDPGADSTMLGSNRPTPTLPPPSVGKTTVPETPAALAKVRAKTMPGVSEDANQNGEWAKKQQEFAADQKQAKELLEKKVFNAVVSLDKKSAPPEGMLNSQVTLPTIPVKDVGKEKRGGARRTWGVYAGAAAVVGFMVIAGVAMWRLEGRKNVVPPVVSAASVASTVPEAVSPPPPSATSPPMVQVAERDASRVTERHDASNAASASTVTITTKPGVRSHWPQPRRPAVTEEMKEMGAKDAAAVAPLAKPVEPTGRNDDLRGAM